MYSFGQLLAEDRVVVEPEVAQHLDEPAALPRPSRRRPPPPPPIDARSFISVVSATVQPWLTSPRRWSSGTRTSLKNTSLNDAPPVIWRSGRTSTPGRLHVDHEAGEALVLGLVGVGAADDLADVAVLGARGPHLLAVDDPLVAVALGPGLQAGEVGAGARLAEQLAGDDVAAVHRRQVARPSPRRWRGRGSSGRPCRARCRRTPGRATSYRDFERGVEPLVGRPAAPGRRTPRAR